MLYPAVLVLVCSGVFSINNSTFDVWVVAIFGAMGYAMRLLDFPPAPLLLGYVLGPLMEENVRRALLISRGEFMVFLERPISATFIGITIVLLVWAVYASMRRPARSGQGVLGS